MLDKLRQHIMWSLPALCLAAVLAVVAAGCNTEGCTDNRSALPLMGFYSSSTEQPMGLDSVAIGGVHAPDDSLLVYPGKNVGSLYLPFRFDSDRLSFFFHYDYKEQGLDDPALNDTITFHYTAEPYFASEECGAYFRYLINKVEYTTHLIAEVVVTDSVITNVERERIKVYIRTTDSESEVASQRRQMPSGGGGR